MWYMDRSLLFIKLHKNSKLSFVMHFLSKDFTSFEVPYEGPIVQTGTQWMFWNRVCVCDQSC